MPLGTHHSRIWQPLKGMPDGAREWLVPGYAELSEEWASVRASLTNHDARMLLDKWLEKRGQAFAIETGLTEGLYTIASGWDGTKRAIKMARIEGVYTPKTNIIKQFIGEGFASVMGSHPVENVEDQTTKAISETQDSAYKTFSEDIEGSPYPFSQHTVRTWHQLVTRYQDTVAGVDRDGHSRKVQFEGKGSWKMLPNNPYRPDGVMHEYCPPEMVQKEMDNFFTLHSEIEPKRYPVYVEAGWMHHRFVCTHPFQDGNGRVSRMLVAYAFIRRGEPPPVIPSVDREHYIDALEKANTGELRSFTDYLGQLALETLKSAVQLGRQVLGTTCLPPMDTTHEGSG